MIVAHGKLTTYLVFATANPNFATRTKSTQHPTRNTKHPEPSTQYGERSEPWTRETPRERLPKLPPSRDSLSYRNSKTPKGPVFRYEPDTASRWYQR